MLAELDDDLSALSLPAEEFPPAPSPQEAPRSGIDITNSSESIPEEPISRGAEVSAPWKSSKPSTFSTSSGKLQKQRYPLYQSISQLLHENGISGSEADNIPASGPKGRLLKGDVLGYLGRILPSYSSEQSTRITKLGHLDLRSVKAAPPKGIAPSQTPKAQAQSAPISEYEMSDTQIAVPISLSSVISVQKRIQATLGVTLPLSTFIARATDLANDGLPRSAATRLSTDELFNDVLGLHRISNKASKGRYLPQIAALPAKPPMEKGVPRRQPDVYDILISANSITAPMEGIQLPSPDMMNVLQTGESTKVFSVSAAKGEEKRARVFLERVKTILQVEPGRLILCSGQADR